MEGALSEKEKNIVWYHFEILPNFPWWKFGGNAQFLIVPRKLGEKRTLFYAVYVGMQKILTLI